MAGKGKVADNGREGSRGRARPEEWTPDVVALLQEWARRAAAAKAAHYELVAVLRARHYRLGVPVVVLSSLVGTSLFATLTEQEVNQPLRAVIGAVSVLAAVLAGLQTFLRYGEQAERHVMAADWYASVQREIEEALVLPVSARPHAREFVTKVRKEMSKVGQQSPEISEDRWRKVSDRFGAHSLFPFDAASAATDGAAVSPAPAPPAAGR
jgi:hypothetical protein